VGLVTVSVLLATMGRPEKAQACVQSIKDTAEDVEIVVAVDGPEADARALADMGCVVDHATEPRGSSRAWNDALAISTGDPVVLAADDLEFRYGWLDAALGTLQEFPDGWGLVGFNDGHWRDELSTHYLMSRRFIVEVLGGVIAWDVYRHSFNDREANERARRAGRYAWCENAHVFHRHWIFGERPQDSTDTRLLGLHGESQRVFDERQAAGFPDVQEAVITDVL
jgi:glycosyltransferase involved in cell wall biosynthesis